MRGLLSYRRALADGWRWRYGCRTCTLRFKTFQALKPFQALKQGSENFPVCDHTAHARAAFESHRSSIQTHAALPDRTCALRQTSAAATERGGGGDRGRIVHTHHTPTFACHHCILLDLSSSVGVLSVYQSSRSECLMRLRRKRSGRPCGHGSGAWPAAEGCNAASDAPAGTAAAAAAAATGGGGAAPPCSSTSSMGGCSTHATISPIEMHGSVHLGRAPALRELRVARDGGGHLLSGVGRAQEYGRREGLTRHGACLH